jgi:hypothetical protein
VTRDLLTELADARAAREGGTAACEATWSFLGIEAPCGVPAIGRFTRACVHEHVRTGRLCRDHAETPERGLCRTCWDLPGALSHECPISIAEVTA